MIAGQDGQNRTEALLSGNQTARSTGAAAGQDRTAPYRGVRLSGMSGSPSQAGMDQGQEGGKTREDAKATCAGARVEAPSQPSSRPTPSLAKDERGAGPDKPQEGVGPVRWTVSGFAFLSEDEAGDFEERAAIREFVGGLSRPAAERLAYAEILNARQQKSRSAA